MRKKSLLLLVSLIAVFAIAACSSNADNDGESGTSSKHARLIMPNAGNDYLIASGMVQQAKEDGEEIAYTVLNSSGDIDSIRNLM